METIKQLEKKIDKENIKEVIANKRLKSGETVPLKDFADTEVLKTELQTLQDVLKLIDEHKKSREIQPRLTILEELKQKIQGK